MASADASELVEEQALEVSHVVASADASELVDEQALEACPLRLARFLSWRVALATCRQEKVLEVSLVRLARLQS